MSDNTSTQVPDIGLANDLDHLRRQLVLMAVDQSGGEVLVLNNRDFNTLVHYLDCYSESARKLENLAYGETLTTPGTIRKFNHQQEEGTNIVRLIPQNQ